VAVQQTIDAGASAEGYRVTAIIPVYNGMNMIRRAIDSILAQTHIVEEVLVVDDGSTDSTRDVVKSYGDRVQYIYQPNGGVSAARNTGVRTATSEWVGFLDHDDEWLPHKIERQLKLLKANPSASLCYTAHWFHALDGTIQFIYVPKEKLWPAIRLCNPFPPSVALVRKKDVLSLGGFDEQLTGASCEDWDFFARFLAAYGAIDSPEPLVNYHELRTSHSRNYRTMLPNTLSIVDKSLLSGLSGMSKALWRRRIKSMLYYRAAISARELGDPAGTFLLASLVQWPFPDLAPQRFKTVLAHLRE
jgi:glycosyltransferase involved in cell wall biosynthesis